MNEQRLQAYSDLINALLTCKSGEAGAILSAQIDWVDAELVQEEKMNQSNFANVYTNRI